MTIQEYFKQYGRKDRNDYSGGKVFVGAAPPDTRDMVLFTEDLSFVRFYRTGKNEVTDGIYLTLYKFDDGVAVLPTKEYMNKYRDEKEEHNWADFLSEVFEGICCNSDYEFHHDLGNAGFGLTSASGLTWGWNREEEEDTDFELYYFDMYAIRDERDEIARGMLWLDKA